MLKIDTLGRFQIKLDDAPVEIPLRRAQSLLAWLAIHRGEPQRRERLAGMYWPEVPDETARTNLRHALWRIRKALENDRRYLIADDIAVQFDPEADLWLDAAEFERGPLEGVSTAQLVSSLDLYHGEFLPGFYEDWVVLERERLQAVLDRRMTALLRRLGAEGRWEGVIDWAERWIALSYRPEPAYRALMIAHANLDDLPGMAAAYRRCVQELRAELGIEPSPETTELHDRLAAGERVLDLAGDEGAARPAAVELEPEPGDCPYKGLEFFEARDADLFYGRELLTARLVDHLREHRFLAIVVGASGSGKSSIVRAGLIPALQRGEVLADGRPAGSADWQILVMTPGAQPMRSLEACLEGPPNVSQAVAPRRAESASRDRTGANPPADGRLLLIVDQFEEVFTLCPDEGERRAFIDWLMQGITPQAQVGVVVALRADFYAHCAPYEKLREALAEHQQYIGPMNAAELRRVIEEPARQGGWQLETGLADLILRDVGDEPGGLPLLSHALMETWKRRRGRTLTIAGYAESGGVRRAIAQSAERVYQAMAPQERQTARRIFLNLTELGRSSGEGGLPAPDSRRRASMEELAPRQQDAGLVRGVLSRLVEARLVTVGQGMAEVAHEALIREWPQLRQWLTEDRSNLLFRQQLRDDALEWSDLDRTPDVLYRGARLTQALEWTRQHDAEVTQLEREFLSSSEAEAQARQARELRAAQQLAESQRHAARRLRRFAYVLSVALLAAVGLAVAATSLGRVAQRQEQLAQSRELAAAAITRLEVDPELSILLALEAERVTHTREAESALHRAVFASRLQSTLRGHTGPVGVVLYHPDAIHLVTAGADGTVRFWEAAGGQEVLGWQAHSAPINGLAFSPDGARVASSGEDGMVRLWDAQTGALQQDFSGGGGSLAFSPDGRWLAAGAPDRSVELWDLKSGNLAHRLEGHDDLVISLAFTPDSTALITAGWDARLITWDVLSGEARQEWEGEFGELAVSPERNLLFASFSAGARLVDIQTGEETTTTGGHTNLVQAAGIDSAWDRIATGGLDRKIIVSSAPDGRALLTLAGHTGAILDLAFSPDGRQLASASEDGTARQWNLRPAHEALAIETQDGYGRIAFSPDGRLLAAGDVDLVKVWDVRTGEQRQAFSYSSLTTGVAFSPAAPRLAAAAEDGEVKIWRLDSGLEELSLHAGEALVFFLAFSPDGRLLAVASEDGWARVFDVVGGGLLLELPLGTPVLSVGFSPDGSRLLTTDYDGQAVLWDTATGDRLTEMRHDGLAWGGAFSPDGSLIATAGSDGTARIWEAASATERLRLTAHTSTVVSAAFHPAGDRVATVGRDGLANLWDVGSGELLLSLEGDGEGLNGVAISPDGTLLATAGGRAVRLYLLDLADLVELAQSRVTRSLTEEECRVYLHTEGCPP